jgi:hypothetical protein
MHKHPYLLLDCGVCAGWPARLVVSYNLFMLPTILAARPERLHAAAVSGQGGMEGLAWTTRDWNLGGPSGLRSSSKPRSRQSTQWARPPCP